MKEKHSHCSYCGYPFSINQAWPRICVNCQSTTFLNPLPVTCVLVPIDNGLLFIRRAIPPQQGMLALPGGYINLGETWQAAGAREVLEETGVFIRPEEIREFRVHSAPDGTVLIFGLAQPRSVADLPPFTPTDETSERVVAQAPDELAFPLHTVVVREYFSRYPGHAYAWSICAR